MTEDTLLPFDLPAVKRKKVTADFGGGLISSDGGLVLLRGAECRLGLAETLAGCIREWRDPERVVHVLPGMLRFRMFAIACGYEDGGGVRLRERAGRRTAVPGVDGKDSRRVTVPSARRANHSFSPHRPPEGANSNYCASLSLSRFSYSASRSRCFLFAVALGQPDGAHRPGKVVAACQAVERLASEILLNNLALESDAVGSVLCHGRRSFECPTHRSNHFNPHYPDDHVI